MDLEVLASTAACITMFMWSHQHGSKVHNKAQAACCHLELQNQGDCQTTCNFVNFSIIVRLLRTEIGYNNCFSEQVLSHITQMSATAHEDCDISITKYPDSDIAVVDCCFNA